MKATQKSFDDLHAAMVAFNERFMLQGEVEKAREMVEEERQEWLEAAQAWADYQPTGPGDLKAVELRAQAMDELADYLWTDIQLGWQLGWGKPELFRHSFLFLLREAGTRFPHLDWRDVEAGIYRVIDKNNAKTHENGWRLVQVGTRAKIKKVS